MAVAPWIVSDELWELIEPLLPRTQRRFRYPGRKRLPDRHALQGILFVLHTGIAWRHLPAELGSGSTCYRRLDDWRRAGVWERLPRQRGALSGARHQRHHGTTGALDPRVVAGETGPSLGTSTWHQYGGQMA
jgi:Putative transposase of IS4/5 family (DUF4096)